jgi:hypothetical protein
VEKDIKEYMEMLRDCRHNFEKASSYPPDMLVIHPQSRSVLHRIIQTAFPFECASLLRIDSFLGMKVVESELFTTPRTAIIISGESLKKVIEQKEFFLMRMIGVEIPLP